ncbi:thioesterase domain-containing protein, partial [Pseudomonas aeruginosa]|uniref:thioesterase domain-containing protein n=1 Tax=Pseudomonas aeruginosa TaxID=287 RepID=UPI00396846A2
MGGTPVRLFCLPYSGASAMTYSRWRRKLPAWLAVRPVELPGRGARMARRVSLLAVASSNCFFSV